MLNIIQIKCTVVIEHIYVYIYKYIYIYIYIYIIVIECIISQLNMRNNNI